MPRRGIFDLYKMIDDICNFEQPYFATPQYLSDTAAGIAAELHVPQLCVVGGAVRDCVLAQATGRVARPKDLDVILPTPPALDKNPNIIAARKNSLGGYKIKTKNFGAVDVFQQYTETPEYIIMDFFDFNCNSLFYRMRDNAIITSVFFHEFLESKTIRPQRVLYTQNAVIGQYGVPQTVVRALKFQIKFAENFDIKTKLSSDILYMIYNMTQTDERAMVEYMSTHVSDARVQKMILKNYQNIRK